MKFLLPILLLVATYLTPLYPVYAMESSTSAYATSSSKLKYPINEKIQEKMEMVKDHILGRKEMMASREAVLKERLAKFRDKIKAQRVERINSNLNKVSENRINAYKKHYETLLQLLTKIEDKINEAEKNGKDMTSAKSALATARTELDKAKAAIDAQAEKDYTVIVSDEATVRSDAQTARGLLATDIKSVHELVITARKSLKDVITSFLGIFGEGGLTNGQ